MDYQSYTDKLQADTGVTQASNKLLFKALPYQFQFFHMTYQRTERFMQNGAEICVLDRLKTPAREKSFLFSKPVNLFLSRRLYQVSSEPPVQVSGTSATHPINLGSLFKQYPTKKILISAQTAYGAVLDEQIKNLPAKNKIMRSGAESDTAIIDMFSVARAEFALLFPQQLFELGRPIAARSYELQGVKPYVTGHMMCSDSPRLRKFIADVNQHLLSLYQSGQLKKAHLDYLSPDSTDIFLQYFQQMIASSKLSKPTATN